MTPARAKKVAKVNTREATAAAGKSMGKPPGKTTQLVRRRRKARLLPEVPPQTKAYMSPTQQKWFQGKLEQMLAAIKAEALKTTKDLQQQERGLADELDRAHNEFAFVVDLRENERISNLQEKINHALRLLETGMYGYCDDCGEQISLQRMTARPVATKCIDCKQFQELQENNVA